MSYTATKIKDLKGWNGHASLYKCDPPLRGWDHDEEGGEINGYEYVIASAAVVPYGGGPETYLFPADEAGNIKAWGELPGSQKGVLDHGACFEDNGYEVVHEG